MNATSSGPSSAKPLRIGTRGSALARWQADWVSAELQKRGFEAEQIIIKTGGDGSTVPLNSMGGVGVFTREIQTALLEHRVDLAVHSLKDLPTDKIDGLALSAVPVRANVHDVLVSNKYKRLDELPDSARVGTGSVRRKAQLLHRYPKLEVMDIRGNVDTRLRKLDDEEYDAIILAAAGLERLEWSERIAQQIPLELMLPAVGQGALGIETRSDDDATIAAVSQLTHAETFASVIAERALLASLRAGCLAPVGAHATVTDGRLNLQACVLNETGNSRIEHSGVAEPSSATQLGIDTANALIAQGATKLIAESRQ
ncbi:MAG: hydroxymethylbilane synthase [Planctomycetota bacterium]